MPDVTVSSGVSSGSDATNNLRDTIVELSVATEKQTQTLIRLTWALVVLTVVIVALTVVLVIDAV